MKTDKGCCTSKRNVNDICEDILINQISAKVAIINLKSDVCDDEVELNLGDYEIEVRNGKTYAVKKKPKYPKTYEECCKVLGSDPSRIIVLSNRKDIIHEENKHCSEMYNLYQLLICRDAYWKIADNWEPDWDDNYQKKWLITFYQDEINFTTGTNVQFILAFPTAEMRDAFYENFKDMIEKCKELL